MHKKTFALPATNPYVSEIDIKHNLAEFWDNYKMLKGLYVTKQELVYTKETTKDEEYHVLTVHYQVG